MRSQGQTYVKEGHVYPHTRKLCLRYALFLITLPLVASANFADAAANGQGVSLDHPFLLEYRAWHEHEHTMLDNLSSTEEANLPHAYSAHSKALKHVRKRHQESGGVRFLSDGEAYRKALEGNDKEAALDIVYRMLVESGCPESLDELDGFLDEMLLAIDGESNVKRLNDFLYRMNVEQALAASGCASELAGGYGLSPLEN